MNLEIERLDVKIAFLHEATERICSEGTEEARVQAKEELVWIETSGKIVVQEFDFFMESQGYKKFVLDHCVFIKWFG